MTREERLADRLRRGLDAAHVAVADDGPQHAGHAGADGGAGHYTVVVVADRFDGLDALARHRAVYAAVGDLIPGEIHAIAIRTYTPDEWQREGSGG